MSLLEIGQRYDTDRLLFARLWTEGDGTGTEGYDPWRYFDEQGVYLGPDQHGIEPLWDWAIGRVDYEIASPRSPDGIDKQVATAQRHLDDRCRVVFCVDGSGNEALVTAEGTYHIVVAGRIQGDALRDAAAAGLLGGKGGAV